MVTAGPPVSPGKQNPIIDKTVVRLAVIGLCIVVAFIALFSRLWFLQVLAAEDYRTLAKENRVRFVYSEPTRGRILDRNGVVLVDSHKTLAITVDRQIVEPGSTLEDIVLRRLSRLLKVPVADLYERLTDATVSPYKPVVVAYRVGEAQSNYIAENPEDFPGVAEELLPIREYPEGDLASQILGYVGEISAQELRSDYFKRAKPGYDAGDIVGKLGVERSYDRWLRGRPAITKVVVDSAGQVVGSSLKQPEQEGHDLYLSLDADVQRLVEEALASGIGAARVEYRAPAGAIVVMDPISGGIIAMASYPSYDPVALADGITPREFDALGAATPGDPDDDALLNRALQAQKPPASTYKVVTAGAALATGVADVSTVLDCPGSAVYPPEAEVGQVRFRNWTTEDLGLMGFAQSLEQSCDTFYYELGWRMEDRFGPVCPPESTVCFTHGDGTDRFQAYARTAGLGHPTGVDLPYEAAGRVPDQEWCLAALRQTRNDPSPTCALGWLPGFTVNMAIGQGDVIATPLQMAVTYAAIANGGSVLKPRIGWRVTDPEGVEPRSVREFSPAASARLPLEPAEIEVIEDGLQGVVGGVNGTARPAFAGFPLGDFPVAGKTGTAELPGDFNDAWFVAYGPVGSPEYVVSVYVEEAGHGGESAAPIARQILEALFGIDGSLEVRLSEDAST